MMRKELFGQYRLLPMSLSCLLLAVGAFAQGGAPAASWVAHGGDLGNTKYSSLDQIDASNVKDLEVAWRWHSTANATEAQEETLEQGRFEGTSLAVDGTLYVSTGFSQVAAIDGETGQTLWSFDTESWRAGRPANLGFVHRGVAYWKEGGKERLFIGTGDARLFAIDAKTGEADSDFGAGGSVDLTQGMRRAVNQRQYGVSSPPVVCRDVVVVGASISDGATGTTMPPGDIRGFDVRTGEQLWRFQSVPQEGEHGNDTWGQGSWKYTGNTNVWSVMSADPELGYVYLPFGTPTNDFYGGHRPGANLFAESLVCLDARTGERVWHFQMVHHGLWDYDLPTAPTLVDINVDGRAIKAIAQVSKQGFCYVFDRATGEPVWPIEERAVPQSQVEGERTHPTQPFPTKPPAFERQGISVDELNDFTPELRAEAIELLERYDYGPLFTPPTEKGMLMLPGWVGGANWHGAAADPETGVLYVPSISSPISLTLFRPDASRTDLRFRGRPETIIPGPQGLPLLKPPYSRVTAIDLNRGEHLWVTPLGRGPVDHPLLKDLDLDALGSGARGFPLVTKTLLFVAQESFLYSSHTDPMTGHGDGRSTFRAFDKATGALLWESELPASVGGNPTTYMKGGRQYLLVPIGGGGETSEILAFSLSSSSTGL